ncbi:MAG: F420-dependent methylenetetrahydromethanopterin dehydrogenase [Euryarchaeota archaeon]|nr:F420-dependent methylenetetrahydromethanopterin dehydrogenase [Euryarchaeota archaeon]
MSMRIGVLKTGNIATSLVLELLLDERADREGIGVEVHSTGAKMQTRDAEELLSRVDLGRYDLILYTTPNPSAKGPRKVIEALRGRRAIVIGDSPGVKMKDELEELGLGYIFVLADSMIGARREFLDPTEMVLFNADMLKVLAATGALRLVQEEIDLAIEAARKGEDYLPRVVVNGAKATARGRFANPYARAKARAAYEAACLVGELNVKGCFVVKEPEKYIPLVASAHELLRGAAKLCDEARELEKGGDSVARTPHSRSGEVLSKRRLLEKPE